MVKGTTRQVILVKGTGEKLFEQAIFLVRDEALAAGGVTEEALLKEAKAACAKKHPVIPCSLKLLWACSGAGATGLIWLVTALLS